MNYKKLLIIPATILISTSVFAQSPDALVKSITLKVIKELKTNKAAIKANPNKVNSLADKIINKYIIPHTDINFMGASIVGKPWRSATPSQKTRFIGAFKKMVVRTYSSALLNYTDQTMVVLPTRVSSDASQAIVKAKFVNGSANIPVAYQMVKKGGAWKMQNVKIAGFNLISNMRSSYKNTVRTKGLEGLINLLEAKVK